MKLLVVTQAVDRNDPILGFFHEWLLEFSKHVDLLTVICLFEGEHELPENVRVFSLGKEKGKQSRFSYSWRFLKLAMQERSSYDAVFVHMNPEYLVIAGWFWKLFRKESALWYMHKSVTLRLRLGIFFVDHVLTGTRMSMRVQTRKKRVMGHGISLEHLRAAVPLPYPPLKLLSIGRISRIKRLELFLDALSQVRAQGVEATLLLAGTAITDDDLLYEKELKERAVHLGIADAVTFAGSVAHNQISILFGEAHLFLHASATGSLDKASLEPLASGVPVITSQEELASNRLRGVVLAEPTGEDFARKIMEAIEERLWENEEVRAKLRAFVLEKHELSRLVKRILTILSA